jgi:hypothetical protein
MGLANILTVFGLECYPLGSALSAGYAVGAQGVTGNQAREWLRFIGNQPVVLGIGTFLE